MLLAGDAPGWGLGLGFAGPLWQMIRGGFFRVGRGEGQSGHAKVLAEVVSDGLDEGASGVRWGLDGIAGEGGERERGGGLALGGLGRGPGLLVIARLLSGRSVCFLLRFFAHPRDVFGLLSFCFLSIDAVLHLPEAFGRDPAAGYPQGSR